MRTPLRSPDPFPAGVMRKNRPFGRIATSINLSGIRRVDLQTGKP